MTQSASRNLVEGLALAGLNRIAVETRLRAYRTADLGGVQPVLIVVHDFGPNAGDHRFHVVARIDGTCSTATGNPAATLRQAIAAVQWGDLRSSGQVPGGA